MQASSTIVSAQEAPAGYAIRRAHEGDISAVVALSERWAAEANTYGQIAATAEQVGGWLAHLLWVAEREGTVVAFACARLQTSEGLAVIPAGERYLEVEELYVAPEHRSRGVGGALQDRVLAEAAAEGVTRGLVYSSSKDWRRSVAFYERHGFQMWYVQMFR